MNPEGWEAIVVEDTYDDQQVVGRILTHFGVKVHLVKSGLDCIALLEQINPTVIITDLALPDIDGWQILVAVRSNVASAHIPVVAVTAYHSSEVASKANQVGFDGYFAKPLNPLSFVNQLAEILNK